MCEQHLFEPYRAGLGLLVTAVLRGMARFTQCEQKSRSVLSTPNMWQKNAMDQARSPEVDQYLERQED